MHINEDARLDISKNIINPDCDKIFEKHNIKKEYRSIIISKTREYSQDLMKKDSVFRKYYKMKIRNPLFIIYICGLSIVSIAVFILIYERDCIFPPNATNQNPTSGPNIALLLSCLACIATVGGWIFTSYSNYRLAKIKHAIDLVSARFSNAKFVENMTIFNKAFLKKHITLDLIKDMEKGDDTEREAVQAMRFLLNFFEFVSVGIQSGEIDMHIINETIKGNIIYYYDKCESFIVESQKDKPSTLINLTKLRLNFKDIP